MPPVDIQRGTSSKQSLRGFSVVPLVVVGQQFTHYDWNATERNSTSCDGQGIKIETHPIKQKLSRNPASSVTS